MSRALILFAVLGLGGCVGQPASQHDTLVSQRLDAARAQITPPLGATVYELDHQRLVDQPGGENSSLAGSLAQLRGVAIPPTGQTSVRGQSF